MGFQLPTSTGQPEYVFFILNMAVSVNGGTPKTPQNDVF